MVYGNINLKFKIVMFDLGHKVKKSHHKTEHIATRYDTTSDTICVLVTYCLLRSFAHHSYLPRHGSWSNLTKITYNLCYYLFQTIINHVIVYFKQQFKFQIINFFDINLFNNIISLFCNFYDYLNIFIIFHP